MRKELLQEIDYNALKRQKERPNSLYYRDALWEVFLEMLDQIQGKNNE